MIFAFMEFILGLSEEEKMITKQSLQQRIQWLEENLTAVNARLNALVEALEMRQLYDAPKAAGWRYLKADSQEWKDHCEHTLARQKMEAAMAEQMRQSYPGSYR